MRIFHAMFETLLVILVIIISYATALVISEVNHIRVYREAYKYHEEFGKLLDYKQIRSHRNLMKRFIESEMERKDR